MQRTASPTACAECRRLKLKCDKNVCMLFDTCLDAVDAEALIALGTMREMRHQRLWLYLSGRYPAFRLAPFPRSLMGNR